MHHPTLYNVWHFFQLTAQDIVLVYPTMSWTTIAGRDLLEDVCPLDHCKRTFDWMLTNKTALCGSLHPVYCARSGCTDWCKLHTALASLCSRPCCAYRHTPALISPHTPCFHIKRLPLITSSNIARQIVTLIKLLLLIIWKCGVKYPGKKFFQNRWYHKRHPIHHSDMLWLNCVFASML